MCGRFALGVNADDLAANLRRDYFRQNRNEHQQDDQQEQHEEQADEQEQPDDGSGDDGVRVEWASLEAKSQHRPRYNVAPTTRVAVLRRNDKDSHLLQLDLLKWGLVPHWYSEPPQGLSTINAQCESVFEGTPAWRGPRERKRCVVFAQGFYEWLQKPGQKDKQPHFVKHKDGRLMAFGSYDPVTSCTILTVPVNKQLRFLHTRMPAILPAAAAIETWLSDRPWGDDLKRLVRPFEGVLECYPVDKGVGKAGNESEDFIKPIAQKKGSLDSLFAKQAQKASTSTPSSGAPASSPLASSSSSSAATTKDAKPKREQGATSPASSTSGAGKGTKRKASDEPGGTREGGRPKKEAKKEEEENKDGPSKSELEDEAMNPDEDAPEKVEKVAREVRSGDGQGAGGKKEKKAKERGSVKEDEEKGVEVIELDDSDDEEEEGKTGKKAKEVADKEGNEALTDFFPVVEGGD
ncbi:hypothetical protein Rhopal_007598-T1 [Rhodotorula paludigena]|uniref:DUF159-domain-containing protein n=1 Tax=Rhodotorula paludigena TaxID=86838 RepID=A0AAV5GYH8_9BASI|nr:hypothetical protein Rhopal_007598-T1 [Rhodotorula paludigena]